MPDFWNKSSLEPKRQHRWTLHLHNSGVPTYVVKKVDKPSFKINESVHDYFGHKFYYPGAVEWNTVTVTLVDPVDPDTSKDLQALLQRSGYNDPTTRDGSLLSTVSKADSVAALGPTVVLRQYDGATNKQVEAWTLFNPWIKEVKFGSLDYSSDDMVEIDLTIRYDWATLG